MPNTFFISQSVGHSVSLPDRRLFKGSQSRAPRIKAPQINAPQINAPQIKPPQIKALKRRDFGQNFSM